MSNCLILEKNNAVLTLTLSRPEQRNAINLDLVEALRLALKEFESDDSLNCAIVTGAAPAFCAGLDIKAFSDPDAPRHLVTELITSLPKCPKPIIAAVNGAAYTGGLELALACDFILAGENARFADTHAKIGALSGSGMGSRLPFAIGSRFAKQMMLSCEPIDAATALRIGLANEVVQGEMLIARATAIAEAIANHDPALVRTAKGVVDRGADGTLAEALEIERQALARRKAERPMAWKR